MMTLLRFVSYVGLALSLLPAVLLFQGAMSRSAYLFCMSLGMLLWFGGAFFWVKPPKQGE